MEDRGEKNGIQRDRTGVWWLLEKTCNFGITIWVWSLLRLHTCTHNKEEKTVSIKRLIYIGESEDVNNRISGHEKWDDWESYLNKGEVICVSCAPVSDGNRVRAEAAMIYKHDPPENTEYVGYSPFDKTKITTSGENMHLSSTFVIDRDD